MFQQATIPVTDPANFDRVRAAVERSFAPAGVEAFLKSLDRGRLRIREFEQVLTAGKLGKESAAEYARLSPGDQGMIREAYLAALERVPQVLRDRYFRLYAYY